MQSNSYSLLHSFARLHCTFLFDRRSSYSGNITPNPSASVLLVVAAPVALGPLLPLADVDVPLPVRAAAAAGKLPEAGGERQAAVDVRVVGLVL